MLVQGQISQGEGLTIPAANMPHDSPLLGGHTPGSDEGSMTLKELTVLLKKLEHKVKSSKSRRRAKIMISDDEDSQEDPSKQGRKIAQIDEDEGITLVHMKDYTVEPNISTANVPVSTAGQEVSTASPEVRTAAKSLVYIRRSAAKRKDKGKAIMKEAKLVQKKIKLQLEQERLGLEEALRLQEQLDEEERQRIARKLSFDEIKELFKFTIKRVSTFTPIESDDTVSKVVVGSSKRDVEQELNQESSKRQKIREGSEPAEESKYKESGELSQEQLQQLIIIVPEEGMNVEALQTKYSIVDWEVYTEDSRKYWKIIRVGD
ncbi:hypothetical protein Tco_1358916, partial [Tanacetum coccineum]